MGQTENPKALEIHRAIYDRNLKANFTEKIQKAAGRLGYEIRKKSFIPSMDWGETHRFLYYKRLYDMTKNVEGDVVECGVGGGRSFLMLAYIIKDEGKARKLWGFDSFEGYPETDDIDATGVFKRTKGMSSHSMGMVQTALRASGIGTDFINTQTTLVKGYFEESLKQYRGDKISFLHIDANLYNGYMVSLKELYPKVSKGGVICFDEYMSTTDMLKYPGAQKAIEEYFGGPEKILRDYAYGKYYVIKE